MHHSMPQLSTQLLSLALSSACIVDVFFLSRVAFAFCIPQVLPIRSLRDFLGTWQHKGCQTCLTFFSSYLCWSIQLCSTVDVVFRYKLVDFSLNSLVLGFTFWVTQLFGRGFWSCKGARGFSFAIILVSFGWLPIFYIRVVFAVVD